MFSLRSKFDTRKNRLALLLERKRDEGIEVLDFSLSNPTLAGFDYPGEAIQRAFAHPGALTYKASPTGLKLAREAVAQYYDRRNQSVSVDDIVLTSSTSEAYSFLFKLLADAGDSVLIPQPSYPLFEYLAHLEGIQTVPYALHYSNGWHFDFSDLEKAFSPNARAVLVVSPNNPTGSFLGEEAYEHLAALCEKKGAALICDEVFFDYPLDSAAPKINPAFSGNCLTYILNGLSKCAGLPQAKLSWIVAQGPERLRQESLNRLEIVADTYLSVGSAVQYAAPELFRLAPGIRNQILNRVQSNLERLEDSLKGTAAECLKVEGGWYSVVRLPRIQSDEEWALQLLEESNLLVHPGSFFGFSSGADLVLSLLLPEETFQTGIQTLVRTF